MQDCCDAQPCTAWAGTSQGRRWLWGDGYWWNGAGELLPVPEPVFNLIPWKYRGVAPPELLVLDKAATLFPKYWVSAVLRFTACQEPGLEGGILDAGRQSAAHQQPVALATVLLVLAFVLGTGSVSAVTLQSPLHCTTSGVVPHINFYHCSVEGPAGNECCRVAGC